MTVKGFGVVQPKQSMRCARPMPKRWPQQRCDTQGRHAGGRARRGDECTEDRRGPFERNELELNTESPPRSRPGGVVLNLKTSMGCGPAWVKCRDFLYFGDVFSGPADRSLPHRKSFHFERCKLLRCTNAFGVTRC